MKHIPLSKQGKNKDRYFAIVDDDDYESLSRKRWNLTSAGYAAHRGELMHRLIMNAPEGVQIDHINFNKLDNRKLNLRFANNSQNQANRPKSKGMTSRYKGVFFDKGRRKFSAQIGSNGRCKRLGYFTSEEEAARAYDKAAREMFGEFARLNFAE